MMVLPSLGIHCAVQVGRQIWVRCDEKGRLLKAPGSSVKLCDSHEYPYDLYFGWRNNLT